MKELFVSENDWDSHRPMLYCALLNTNGAVVELGSGLGSTPLLRSYCADSNRAFYSFESNKEWAIKTGSIFVNGYIIRDGESILNEMFINLMDLGLMFIDFAPGEERKVALQQYAKMVAVLVVHDTEPGAEYVYGLKEILSTFKYRKDYAPEGKPWTTAVSNFIDVSKWEL